MGRVYKRGKIYWIQFYVHGTLVRESSRATLKSFATTLLKKREGEVVDGRLPNKQAERTSFEDLAHLYLQDYEVNRKKSIRRAK